jgi:hypothetical protein
LKPRTWEALGPADTGLFNPRKHLLDEAVAYIRTSSAANLGTDKDSARPNGVATSVRAEKVFEAELDAEPSRIELNSCWRGLTLDEIVCAEWPTSNRRRASPG